MRMLGPTDRWIALNLTSAGLTRVRTFSLTCALPEKDVVKFVCKNAFSVKPIQRSPHGYPPPFASVGLASGLMNAYAACSCGLKK